MKLTAILATLQLLLMSLAQSQTYKGSITGDVVDGSAQERLPSVNVAVVERSGIGTSTDPEGKFSIENLDVGTYSFKVSSVGYEPQILTNIVVATGRPTAVHIRMKEAVIEKEGATELFIGHFFL